MALATSAASKMMPLLLVLLCARSGECVEGLTEDTDMAALLEAAVKALPDAEKSGCDKDCKDVLKPCVEDKASAKHFATGVHTAVEQMLLKRTKKMRRGIFHAASAVSTLAGSAKAKCPQAAFLEYLGRCAKNLQSFTEKKGHVAYKAMEHLKVTDIDVHKPLNGLIGQFKKDPVVASDFGKALGEFLGPFHSIQNDATRPATVDEGKAEEL